VDLDRLAASHLDPCAGGRRWQCVSILQAIRILGMAGTRAGEDALERFLSSEFAQDQILASEARKALARIRSRRGRQ
jgi:hypothetical protein